MDQVIKVDRFRHRSETLVFIKGHAFSLRHIHTTINIIALISHLAISYL